MLDGTALSPGLRKRNERLRRLRELPPVANVIVGSTTSVRNTATSAEGPR